MEQLQHRKAQLQHFNAAQRQHLSTLTTTLTSLYDSAAPLYATFFPSAAEQVYRPLPDKARELPQPLWQLFCTAWSYCSAFVEDDSVTAHVLEAEVKEERKGEQGRDKSKGKDDVWAAHPLSVVLRLAVAAASSVDLRFHFLPALHLVAVLPVASPSSAAADSSWLLHELYAADDGSVLQAQHLSSFSPAVQQAVQSASPAPASIGRPYVWCQRLCGLHAPIASDVSGQPSSSTDVALADVLLLVRQRLAQQPVVREQLARHKYSPAADTASSSCRVYTRQYADSGHRALSASVEVPHSYPVRPPRFTLHTAGGGGAAVDERKLRALESELNSTDAGTDVRALDGVLDALERQWADCL